MIRKYSNANKPYQKVSSPNLLINCLLCARFLNALYTVLQGNWYSYYIGGWNKPRLSKMGQLVKNEVEGFKFTLSTPRYTLFIMTSYCPIWCKAWNPGEHVWPSVEANHSLWIWIFKANSNLLAFAFSLWWTKRKLLFEKGERKWSKRLQGFLNIKQFLPKNSTITEVYLNQNIHGFDRNLIHKIPRAISWLSWFQVK